MLDRMDEQYAEKVLAVVESIPLRRVMSYGDIAEYLGAGGPRQVGHVLAHSGGVPWWRVVRADGTPPSCHSGEALTRLRAEGTALRPSGQRVDMARARWDGSDSADRP